jgi:hypothetical protein
MQRQPVKSTNLAEVGFEKETGTVEVKFVGGEIYRYGGVPEELYQSMLGASSVGSFFAQYIKRAYPARKVEQETKDAEKEKLSEATQLGVAVGEIKESNPQYEKVVAIIKLFEQLQNEIRANKPNDRTDLDRQYAVTITEVEKAFAYYYTFIAAPTFVTTLS